MMMNSDGLTPTVSRRGCGGGGCDRPERVALRLAGYSAAVASSLGAGAASAEEFSLLFDIDVAQGFNQPLDLNLDGATDLELKNYIFFSGNYQGATVPYAPGQLVGFQAGSLNYGTALQSGDPINASTVGPSFVGSLAYGSNNPNAQWNDVTEGYLGLSFDTADDTQLFYAWVRLSINNANGTLFIHDAFASDDPAGVLAGQGLSVNILGDYNASGQVEQGDLDLVLLNWGTDGSTPPTGWTNDLPSGLIDQSELDGVLLNWGSTSEPNLAGAVVPEPGSLAFLAAGAAGLAAMRRRAERSAHT